MILNFLLGHRPYVRNTRLKMKATIQDSQLEESQHHTSSLRGNSMFVQQRPKNRNKKQEWLRYSKQPPFLCPFDHLHMWIYYRSEPTSNTLDLRDYTKELLERFLFLLMIIQVPFFIICNCNCFVLTSHSVLLIILIQIRLKESERNVNGKQRKIEQEARQQMVIKSLN